MATSAHQPNRPTSYASTPDRPATIAELAALAQREVWDPAKPLKHWLRTAEKARKAGQAHVETQNYEAAFVEFARAATIVLEKLPTHADYHALLNSDQRHNLGMNGQDMLDHLGQLKTILVDRYEKWKAARESNRPSSSQYADSHGREETSRRRREEQQRAEEQERIQQAHEAARREEEWRRQDMARRQAEELERRVREETSWRRQASEARSRETSEARRAADAREAAEHERQAQVARLRREEEARRQQPDEELRKRTEEKTRHEQEGILRRQQEAELAARVARLEISSASSSAAAPRKNEQEYNRVPQGSESTSRNAQVSMPVPVVTPQPSRPASATRNPPQAPLALPMESPRKGDDSTDDDDQHGSLLRTRNADDDLPRNTSLRISYPPPITTTSPAPPELGPIRYPNLMSQHQRTQGYVPSLQSMFAQPSPEVPSSSSLLFDAKPPGSLYTGILPKPPSPPAPYVPPPPPPDMSLVDVQRYPASTYDSRYLTGYRGPPPTVRPAQPLSAPAKSHSHSHSLLHHAPRITKVASKDINVRDLKAVRLPRECLQRFVSIARVNTQQNKETCGLLLGKDKGDKYVVTTLLIPKQHSTSDTCTMDEEELVMQFTEERHLITLGWIHTHPTQSCFMSSVDLHTHSGFQQMLPESFAVVCAPNSTPSFGIFRLTDPGGLQTILECSAKAAFHPHPDVPIYTDCDNSHVVMKSSLSLEIVDLRF